MCLFVGYFKRRKSLLKKKNKKTTTTDLFYGQCGSDSSVMNSFQDHTGRFFFTEFSST